MTVGQIHGMRPIQGVDVTPKHGGRDQSASTFSSGDEEEASSKGVESAAEQETDTRGVIRLLDDGHFKGVADARLRLNFRGELGRTDAERRQAAARESVDRFMAQIDGPIRDMLEAGQLDEEEKSALQKALTQLETDTGAIQETSDNEEPLNAEELYREMEEAFEEFHATLKSIFGIEADESAEDDTTRDEEAVGSVEHAEATPTDEPVEEGEAIGQGDEAADEQDALLEEILMTYQEVIEQLKSEEEALDGVLSPQDEPDEEGSAYAKFAAMYEELYASETVPSLDAEG